MAYPLTMRVRGDVALGDPDLVTGFLAELMAHDQGALAPEYFDEGEPLQQTLGDENLDDAVQAWVGSAASIMLERRSSPAYLLDIQWRKEKGADPRPFPWGCDAYISDDISDENLVRLLRLLAKHLGPTFGFITSDDDLRSKHFTTYVSSEGRVEKYIGLDTGMSADGRAAKQDKLPGIYWTTYFSGRAIELVGREKLLGLQLGHLEEVGNGVILMAYPSRSQIGSPQAREAELQIREALGEQHFFDLGLDGIPSRPGLLTKLKWWWRGM